MDNKPKKQFSFIERYVSGETNSAVWGLIANGLGAVNAFLILSSLSLYQYGVYQLLLQSYAFLSVFIGLGSVVAKNDIFRFSGEGKETYAKKLFFEVSAYRGACGVFFWLVTFLGAPYLSFRFGSDTINIIRILSFLFLYEGAVRIFYIPLSLRMKFFATGSRGAISKLFQLGILLFFFFFKHLGLVEVVTAFVLGALFSVILLIPPFLSSYRPWSNIPAVKERLLIKIMTSYGKWSLLSPVTNKGASFISTWLIKILISTEAVAIFSVAKSMVGLIKTHTPVGTLAILIPLALPDGKRIGRLLVHGTKYLLLLSIFISVAAIISVPPLIRIFFPQYTVALPIFFFMLLHMVVNSSGSVLSLYINALRKQKFLFIRGMSADVLTIVLYLALVPWFGIWGLAFEYVLNPLVMTIILYWYFLTIKPGIIRVHWRDAFFFGEEDKEFLKSLYQTGITSMGRRLRRVLHLK